MAEATEENTVEITHGSVEYSLSEAAVGIDDLIESLVQAKADGAKYVVGMSGNYRGAKYLRLHTEPERLDW